MSNYIWRVIALLHFIFIIGIILSFIILPFKEPFYVWMPIEGFIINLFFNQSFKDCPITKLENKFRKLSGKVVIKSFVGWYILIPIRKIIRNGRISKKNK